MLERCQPELLRPDQCQRQQPGTGTGSRPPPPTICTGMHPAQQIAPPVQTEGQSSSAPRAAALAFFFCPSSSPAACPACRISSRPARPDVRAARPMTTPAHHHRSRSPPPTCTACQQQTGTGTSAAPMTPQPISCTACPLPAHLHRQTSQQQPAASAHRLHPSAAAHPAALPPACRSRSAPPTTAKRPKTSPPRPAAGGVRFFTYPAYRLCSIAVS